MWTDRANVRWETAAALGPGIVRRLLDIGWSAGTCLSVNFPDLPADETGPLTLARQGAGSVQGMDIEARTDPRGFDYYWVSFRRGERDQSPDSDIEALRAGRVVVNPLRYDRTDEERIRAIGAGAAALTPSRGNARSSSVRSQAPLDKDPVRAVGEPDPLPAQEVGAERDRRPVGPTWRP